MMQTFSPARGRKKVVKKFTNEQGFIVLAVGFGASLAILLIFLLGVLHLEID
jgi:uncharacterized membrane protein